MGILHESMHKTLRGMPLFSLLLPSILWFNLSTALRMASKWSLEEQWWPHKYDFQRPLLLSRPEIARFVQFSLRFDYGWGHKVYSLLPLVARKLANECVVSTPVEIPPSSTWAAHLAVKSCRVPTSWLAKPSLEYPPQLPTKKMRTETLFQFLICSIGRRRAFVPGESDIAIGLRRRGN